MDKFIIAVGMSRKSKKWTNREITFNDLCNRLSSTKRTDEKVSEYKAMSKAERDNAKDSGGFVGGKLKGTERLKKDVEYRTLITLDLDDATTDFLENYKVNHKYKTFIYTTHSHEPNKPRYRLVLPLSRNVTPDECVAITRYLADEIGMDMVDKCSFSVNQLMLYPTTSLDGEFIALLLDGCELDPDKYLAEHPNWTDCSTLPIHPSEKIKSENLGKHQQNPYEKKGMIGAFCRTYTISQVIEKYLSDVYEPTEFENRYTFIGGSTSGGAIVYDDLFLYSHHASDPASNNLLNAFDLVRIHKFGHLGEKASIKEMIQFADDDEEVKVHIIEERLSQASEDFAINDVFEDDLSWIRKLKKEPRSEQLENSTENLILILENDRLFRDLAYNEFASSVEFIGYVPWERPIGTRYWRDFDDSQLKALIDKKYLEFSSRNYEVAFNKVMVDRHFHPIRDFLDSLPIWDGIKRVDDLLINFFKAEDNEYVRSVTRKVFTACVARIYEPGIKFDSMMVLDGKQGIGKSSIIRYLAGDKYFSDSLSLTDMTDKTAAEKLQGFWIMEIGELAGMKKADIEKVKSFLSSTDDKYRAAFGRRVESHPRQSVIIATVNGERGYLRDITGNRRFWVVKLNQQESKLTWKPDEEFRKQFWAECVYNYRNGEKLYLEGDVLLKAEEEQRSAMEIDERTGAVETYLETLLPDNWDELDLYQRRNYLSGDITMQKGTKKRTKVSNMEIWCECFGKNMCDLKASDSYQIAAIMVQIGGWAKQNYPLKTNLYGNQRHYIRLK